MQEMHSLLYCGHENHVLQGFGLMGSRQGESSSENA